MCCTCSEQPACSVRACCAQTRLRGFFPVTLPPISDANCAEKKSRKCSLPGWLLNFPLDELSSNTPPELERLPQKNRKCLSRDHPTASQLRHNPLPNPPMNPSMRALRLRNQHLEPPERFLTQNILNFQVFQRWTSPPRMRRRLPSVQALGPPNTLRLQSNGGQGS